MRSLRELSAIADEPAGEDVPGVSGSNYRTYLKSPQWQEKAARIKALHGNTCDSCGQGPDESHWVKLQVHHKLPGGKESYQGVSGVELTKHLSVMCKDCHREHHWSGTLHKVLDSFHAAYESGDPGAMHTQSRRLYNLLCERKLMLEDRGLEALAREQN